jgi:hypothetical protein
VAAIPNVTGGDDELWMVVKRTLNGTTTYCVEYRCDEIDFPDPEDYYTDQESAADDLEDYLGDLFEAQKQSIHLDCSLTYDGRTATAAATLTLSALTVGTGRTITASTSIFTAGMVGRNITGAPWGRAIITGYTSGTAVTVEIVTAFESTTLLTMEWYLTTGAIAGATHLANMEVDVVADGQHIAGLSVDGTGAIANLNDGQYSMIHVGFKYEGMAIGNIIEGGSRLGVSQGKLKNIKELTMRFLHTQGPWVGSRLYHLQRCEFPKVNQKQGWATPLFTGDWPVAVADDWKRDKRWIINQRPPLPCKVQMIVPRIETIDG